MNNNTEEQPRADGCSPDYDLRRHLFETILLLGGKKEIANLLIKSQDCAVSESDIDRLRRYNRDLLDNAKQRLDIIGTKRLQETP